jgi:hypothetical protein
MLVIKSGKENHNFGKHLTCKGHGLGKKIGGCGAILLVKPGDIDVTTDCEGDKSYSFTCPECGAKTYVAYNVFN